MQVGDKMFQYHQQARENYYKEFIDKIDEKFKTPRYDINEEDVSDEDEEKVKFTGSDRSIFKYQLFMVEIRKKYDAK